AVSPRTIAKPSCSRVNRSRTITLGVARLQNGLAPLQNAFTALQNGLAPLQNAFAALFLVLAVVRGAIARLFRRLDGESVQIVGQGNPLELPQLSTGRAWDEKYFR
ncbi:MAG: hypothetical protein IKR83_03510, partial [Bacteroidales bacterium]|nr:hypothetical protein [Bacteroidales bacterium]